MSLLNIDLTYLLCGPWAYSFILCFGNAHQLLTFEMVSSFSYLLHYPDQRLRHFFTGLTASKKLDAIRWKDPDKLFIKMKWK